MFTKYNNDYIIETGDDLYYEVEEGGDFKDPCYQYIIRTLAGEMIDHSSGFDSEYDALQSAKNQIERMMN
jgi:hypothetical protein